MKGLGPLDPPGDNPRLRVGAGKLSPGALPFSRAVPTNNNISRCVARDSLRSVAAVAVMLQRSPACLLFLDISGKRLQAPTEPGARRTTLPMCLRVASESQSGMSL